MQHQLDRAHLLYSQGRFADALEALVDVFDCPEAAAAAGLRAFCLQALGRHKEAESQAREAVRLDPALPYAHYTLGHVLGHHPPLSPRGRLALSSAREAVRLDPHEAQHYALLSWLHLQRFRYKEALAAAEAGLAVDPADAGALEMRAEALARLGKTGEAQATLEAALRHDPEHARAHADRGWLLLGDGKAGEAAASFAEALRLAPSAVSAREGMLSALRARYALYRWYTRLQLRLDRLRPWESAGLIMGALLGLAYALPRLPDALGNALILAVVGALIVYGLMQWLADPCFNLLLRFHPQGRLLLSDAQRHGATALVVALAGGLGMGLLAFTIGDHVSARAFLLMLYAMAICFAAVFPIAALSEARSPRAFKALAWYAGGLAVLSVAAPVVYFVGGRENGIFAFSMVLLGFFYLGILEPILQRRFG